ncbi:MAG: PD40 domain-containing protein [Planctomycetes bacterium]|nr:PD40 domain-containing protein [Planctomycetota bacterium]
MSAASVDDPIPLIGYSEYRADLPGGMLPYMSSMRACVVQADGTDRKRVGEKLLQRPDSWTQFAGWSPDGRQGIIGSGWESRENAAWEEQHQTFRMTDGWLYDVCLVDLATGEAVNLTAVERVSIYNSGLFFWPGDSSRLGFQALIGGESRPFSMDRDGRSKKDLSGGAAGFTYGFTASPDGQRIAYHRSYQVYVASADGSDARHVNTAKPFNFCPTWSPDGSLLLFLAGEHYDCHPWLCRRDGSALRQLASRGGYRGVVEMLEKPAFHSASSDVPVWSADGQFVFYTARVGASVELMRVSREGRIEPLTHSSSGVLHYHPKPSPDGKYVAFGSTRSGTRQLYVMRMDDRSVWPITSVPHGDGAMWAHWQPVWD